MLLSLSNLSFTGFHYPELKQLPANLGLEFFYEFGTNEYWEQILREIYTDRPLKGLSFHGPCISVNLANPNDVHYLSLYNCLFELAAKWNAHFVVVHTNETFSGDKAYLRRMIQNRLGELLDLARKRQVRLLIENVGLTTKNTLLFDWPEYLELLAELPQAGALLDVGHAYINGWHLSHVIEQLGNRLMAAHLHDNQGQYDEHLPVGYGKIDWSSVFAAFRKWTPEITLVFEYDNVDIRTALSSIQNVTQAFFE